MLYAPLDSSRSIYVSGKAAYDGRFFQGRLEPYMLVWVPQMQLFDWPSSEARLCNEGLKQSSETKIRKQNP